jgi:hypothetical protein
MIWCASNSKLEKNSVMKRLAVWEHTKLKLRQTHLDVLSLVLPPSSSSLWIMDFCGMHDSARLRAKKRKILGCVLVPRGSLREISKVAERSLSCSELCADLEYPKFVRSQVMLLDNIRKNAKNWDT